MKINKKTAVSTLALIGLTLGATVSAAEVKSRPMFENITSVQRSMLEEAHQLHQLGKDDEAKELIKSAGIDFPGFGHKKDRREHSNGMGQMQKFKNLIEQNDFASFQKMVAETPMGKIINTEEKFNALVQAHELKIEGKYDEAKQVLVEANIEPFGFGRRK